MKPTTRRYLFEYTVAVLALVIALLVRRVFDTYMGNGYPYVTIFGAVAVAVWIGGWGPGALTAVLGYLGSNYLFVARRGDLGAFTAGDRFGQFLYCVSCAIIIGLGEELRRSRRRVHEDRTELATSEELFRATFELSAIGQAHADPHTGRLLRVNDRFCELTGYAEDELLRMMFLDLTHPDDRAMSAEPFQRLMRGEIRDYRIEKRYVRKDGAIVWVAVNASLTRDAAGRPVRAVAIVQDVTNERHAAHELRRNEEAQRFLVELHDATRWLADPASVTWEFVSRLGRHFDAARCTYTEIDPTGTVAIVDRDYTNGVPSIAGRHRLLDFGAQVAAVLESGQTLAVDDVYADPRTAEPQTRAAYDGVDARAFVAVPLVKDDRLVALLVVHYREPHAWRGEELVLIEQVSERAWDTIERARAEVALRENRDVLSLAMRGGRMGAWSRDLVTERVWWSRELEEIFGLDAGGFEGTEAGFIRYVHEDDRNALASAVEQAIERHEDYVVEFRFLHGSGEWRWMEGRGRAVYSRDGQPRMLYGIGIDITDRKSSEREHAFSAAIVASSDDAIVSKTLGGTITSWNAGAERVFGYTAAEAMGRPITIIIPPDRLDEEHQILAKLRAGEGIRQLETVRVRKDGTLLDISLTVSPVKDASGHTIGVSKIARDITAQKRAQAERDRLLVAERLARERAEEASRVRDEFLATVSHELRTPLNAILGWARLLREGSLDAERSRYAADVVERNARAQAQLIEDLLDVSAIITGKMRLNVRPTMPAAVVDSALDSVRPMADAKGIRLETILDAHAGPVPGDASRLQQVVWNLLSNAIKFTPRSGRVQVRLERVDSHVEIVVSDTGQGIPPEFLPHVFDRFRQADSSSTRSTSGLGLGLAIVRHLVELHGGVVRVDSPGEGKGATFTVRLPLMVVHSVPADGSSAIVPRAGVPVPVPPREAAPRLDGVRVLLVDDEADTRSLLKEVLERCGASVRDAASAKEAFEMVRAQRPSVIVSDIGMPGEDGYTFIRKVREWERGAGGWTPAVALTAYARVEDRKRALLAGYQVHVAKPVEPAEFALVVASLVLPPKNDADREPAGATH